MAAAAALPEGPMPARGVRITGQLTELSAAPDSDGNLAAFGNAAAFRDAAAVAVLAASAAADDDDAGWVEAAAASGRSKSIEQQQGRGVVWNEEEGVVNLEVEAQLKQLTEVLPNGVRQQVGAQRVVAAGGKG
jgi:hypothetical protein